MERILKIYIKENLKNNEKKIIIANEGVLISNINDFSFKLFDGKITNIINNGTFNLSFKETTYDLSKLNSLFISSPLISKE